MSHANVPMRKIVPALRILLVIAIRKTPLNSAPSTLSSQPSPSSLAPLLAELAYLTLSFILGVSDEE